ANSWNSGIYSHIPPLRRPREIMAFFLPFTGEFYGLPSDPGANLQLIKRYFEKYPSDTGKVVLSVKGCFNLKELVPDCSPDNVRKSIDNVLSLLDGKKSLDLFEAARVDPNVPVEETISVIAEYVKEGKVGGIMMSECSAESIRRASKVHRIEAVEIEYSL